jgi:xylulokinase
MAKARYLLGYDVGSSSIKAALLEVDSGKVAGTASSPATELPIAAPRPGWAEQDPEEWWRHLAAATRAVLAGRSGSGAEVSAIGISYQMHGLVLVDSSSRVLRPSIIWCDTRAVEIGEKAFHEIGEETCLSRLLNSPGNFTASKLAWVKENEPEIYRRAAKAMLPGDYIALRLTGDLRTTPSGLSEGILWDFTKGGLAEIVTSHYGISRDLIPQVVPTFSVQGSLTAAAASELGLAKGVPVSYRAGDQPNNAFSLNVLEPGEVATTAGTSGVVYGVASEQRSDPRSRVNTFVHVTHTAARPRYGILLCLNGTGILYGWIRRTLMGAGKAVPYDELNRAAAGAPVGSDGLIVLPYGNGAERTLGNRNIGSSFLGLDFNRHGMPHLLRAAQEGIVFALHNGLQIMGPMGVRLATVRAGYANMFLSPLFAEAFATVTGARLELYSTDGAQGAARGAGVGAGLYAGAREAFSGLAAVAVVEPRRELAGAYRDAYGRWEEALRKALL